MDIFKASEKLSRLDLKFGFDNYYIDILWFRVMIQKKEWHISRHTHSSFEFHYVQAGKCRVILDDDEFIAQEGEFYIAVPGVYHEQIALGEEGYIEYSLNCDIKPNSQKQDTKTEIEYILYAFLETRCRVYKDCDGIIDTFSEALKEAFYERPGAYNYIKSLVIIILTKTARAVSWNKPFLLLDVPKKITKDDARYRLISKFIEDNVESPISTIDISKYMHLSDKQICRIVKNKTGTSTKELINSIKFNKAKELLKVTDLNQKEIANLLGFSSEYYFNQFFKNREGDTPGNFRLNTRNV
ncbi:helix-turn-helix domain-containing protein [Clostridium oryzae]|uniref:HTH-type transcriptional activator Btr n=1 Tax=Clostridium oryzae TaxID=1450648 RepID=A0A1V4IME0_9CLOT|nr:AraC family transcriptional regulator [Clostridium oryzae]OPJ61192.1 HTH-type transcriptional activator Btr [Clostridium oryzae]